MATPKTGKAQPGRGPMTPNPKLEKTSGGNKPTVKGTTTPTKRG